MIESDVKNIFFIETPKLNESNHEGTVDAIHFTDLGFQRYADFLIEQLKEFQLLRL